MATVELAANATDAFAGGAANLAAPWVRHTNFSTGTNSLQRDGTGLCKPTYASGYDWAFYRNTLTDADCWAQADVFITSTPNGLAAIGARLDATAATGYHAYYNYGGGGWQLYKYVNGTGTQLGATSTQTLTANTAYTLKLTCIGSTITLYVNGVSKISVTDTAITAAGYCGLGLYSNTASGMYADNYSQGSVGQAITGTTDTGAGSDASSAPATFAGDWRWKTATDTTTTTTTTGQDNFNAGTTNTGIAGQALSSGPGIWRRCTGSPWNAYEIRYEGGSATYENGLGVFPYWVSGGATQNLYYVEDAAVPAGQFAQCTISPRDSNVSLTGVGGVAVRCDIAGQNYLGAIWNAGARSSLGQWQLIKTIAGVSTTIGTYDESLATGDVRTVRLTVDTAGNYTVTINGTDRITGNDSALAGAGALATGQPGIWQNGVNPANHEYQRIDDFAYGSFVAGESSSLYIIVPTTPVSAVDSATGAEGPFSNSAVSGVYDTATGTEGTSQVQIVSIPVAGSDTGTVTETSAVVAISTVTKTTSDTGAFSESSSVQSNVTFASLSSSDIALLADVSVLTRLGPSAGAILLNTYLSSAQYGSTTLTSAQAGSTTVTTAPSTVIS